MQTFTELVATVVIHTSAMAYSHLGVAIEPHAPERGAPAERTVARAARPEPAPRGPVTPKTVSGCPETPLKLGRA
ncbi:hypothetical protein [Phenylobacterium sp.]|uniref:hypothetical protein n=1 Tax=Phenylobacterium sp. TaxID=1871053 RepID=UPI00272FFE4E|nr:hypothetical protein [Phenylobacterium sp.]MDP2212724.1 hypothetical protein [Phenylobacterium sp.]